jgi:hypothetical protein
MHCPSLNIFGTFFPSWMLCALVGIVAAIASYKLFAVLGVSADLRPALLVYPSISLIVTATVWLAFFGD